MSPAVFIDANVPIYAAGGDHPYKEPCARILRMAAEEPQPFVTDSEVLQELMHRYLAYLEAPTSQRPLPTSLTWNSPHLPSPRPYSYVHSSIFRFTPVPSESTSLASWSGNEKPAI